jgi:prepilin-type N-terminal cleavage/methylation domain-containing protein
MNDFRSSTPENRRPETGDRKSSVGRRFSNGEFRTANCDTSRFPISDLRSSSYDASGVPGFTLIEILLALALTALVLVSLNVFVFSMGELWGRNSETRLFDRHVRAVTRFLERELRTASLPPFASTGDSPIAPKEIRPRTGSTENLLTFELPAGSRILTWPERPLPEVICSLQVRDREGLLLLWHSRLEKKFADDPPRETVVTPFVTGMSYDYYEADFKSWKNEATIRKDNNGQLEAPQRIRLKFTYGALARETVIVLAEPSAGLPNF